MSTARGELLGVVTITFAVVGGVLALAKEFNRYHRTGALDWGHVALAFGAPALIYVIVRVTATHSWN